MGLGRIDQQYRLVLEEDVNVAAMEDRVDNPPMVENDEFEVNQEGDKNIQMDEVFVGMDAW